MSYVLTIIRQPEKGAAHGRAMTIGPVDTKGRAAQRAADLLLAPPYSLGPLTAGHTGYLLQQRELGTEIRQRRTGLVLRIDPADNAPHPCPCGAEDPDPCGRIVLPGEHAYAHDPESFCLGCWGDTVNEGCLPANTAHPVTG